ncbi:MAG: tyrosine-protein phosphatase [Deltaproteobacteria bacterium]|nr:tyrosine-protein phosphatase [Kofleriaceae bacterium]
MTWIDLGGGRLTVRGRPSHKALPGLRSDGCTHIVTLLSEREGAPQLGAAVRAAGLGWFWLPLPNGTPPIGDARDRAAQAIAEMSRLIDGGSSLLIHCAAGIHRTGMIAYALLRWRGLAPEVALERLGAMRSHTREGVGEPRLLWGDELVAGGS